MYVILHNCYLCLIKKKIQLNKSNNSILIQNVILQHFYLVKFKIKYLNKISIKIMEQITYIFFSLIRGSKI